MELFRKLPKKSMVVIEDVDCMSEVVNTRESKKEEDKESTKKEGGNKPGISLSCLLNLLDGVVSGNNLFLIMTTNYVEKLDPALIREGRCDLQIELDYCTHS